MYPDIDWSREPDVVELNYAYKLLSFDTEAAVFRLEKLVSQGSMASLWYLADAYAIGRHVEKDLRRAVELFDQLESLGWRPAAYMQGRVLYQLGDYSASYAAFLRGSSIDYTPAIYRLAMIRYDGLGCEKDIHESENLLIRARRGGNLFAKRDLATIYAKGTFGFVEFFVGLLMILSLIFEIIMIIIRGDWRKEDFDERTLA